MSEKPGTGNAVRQTIEFSDYLRAAKYVKYIKDDLVKKVLLGLGITGLHVLQAVLLARGVAAVFQGEAFSTAVSCYLLAASCIVLRAFLTRYMDGYTKLVAGKIKAVLREQIIEKLLLLGPGYQSDKRSGRFQSLVTDGVEYMEPYLVNYIPQIFVVFFSVFPMVIYIFAQERTAGIVVLAAAMLAILMPHILMPFYTKACVGYWQEYAVLNSQYIDTMQGMNTLKLFNAENTKGEELRRSSEQFRHRQLVNTRNSLISTGSIALLSGVVASVATGVAAYACSGGRVSGAGLLTIMFLVIECVRPITELNTAWHGSMMGFSVSSEILDILEARPEVAESGHPIAGGLDEGLPEIVFRQVDFQYPTKGKPALSQVSLNIAPGETVAIVGRSGSGKTTIVNLLLRFYDVGSGTITINGTDIRDYGLQYLRSKISVVFQNTYLFHGTIRENIAMAAPSASEEDIVEAAKAANIHDFITGLPGGYDTMVGERGDTLSGGQKQRIAIARAILKNAPILIMDEATSSVDASNEKLIQETMGQLKGRFTSIIVAHRLSTVRDAEHICVLEQGRVAEQGNHRELMQRRGIYYELNEAQDGGVSEWEN